MTTAAPVDPNAENWPKHMEDFEIVLLKDGVNPLSAKTTDFKRIKVTAPDPLSAQMSDAVMAEKGYKALFAAKPGVMTDPELQARHRELDASTIDRTKI